MFDGISMDQLDGAMGWLLARSDVEAADYFHGAYRNLASDQVDTPWQVRLNEYREYIDQFWPQISSIAAYDKVYEVAGRIEARVDNVFDLIPNTLRFQIVSQIMQQLGRPNRILDFGCSRAFHAIHLHNLLGGHFTCIDIDQTSIHAANAMAFQKARNPAMMQAVVGKDCLEFIGHDYDAVMCLEVLEHVEDYQVLLDQFERCVKPGGWIVITVPHGPVEYTMWVEHPERNREHIREFDVQDCYDIWGKKPGFHLQMFANARNRHIGLPEGSIFIVYQADREPCGKVNNTRKMMAALNMPIIPLPGFDVQLSDG